MSFGNKPKELRGLLLKAHQVSGLTPGRRWSRYASLLNKVIFPIWASSTSAKLWLKAVQRSGWRRSNAGSQPSQRTCPSPAHIPETLLGYLGYCLKYRNAAVEPCSLITYTSSWSHLRSVLGHKAWRRRSNGKPRRFQDTGEWTVEVWCVIGPILDHLSWMVVNWVRSRVQIVFYLASWPTPLPRTRHMTINYV